MSEHYSENTRFKLTETFNDKTKELGTEAAKILFLTNAKEQGKITQEERNLVMITETVQSVNIRDEILFILVNAGMLEVVE